MKKERKDGNQWLRWDDKESKWVEHKESADIVREIFRLAADGLSNKEIADKGLPPISRRKNAATAWSEGTIDSLLNSFAPIGYLDLKDDDGNMDLIYPEVVELEVWRKVQMLRGTRRTGNTRGVTYALAGLMVCGRCNVKLRFRGQQRRTVECYNGCFKPMNYDELELLVLERLTGPCMPDLTPSDDSSQGKQIRRELSLGLQHMMANVQVGNDLITITLNNGKVDDFKTPDYAIEEALAERPDLAG